MSFGKYGSTDSIEIKSYPTWETRCHALAKEIKTKGAELRSILSEIETATVAQDEIEKSIATLSQIKKLDRFLHEKTDESLCSFLPLNLPLYSLIVSAAIPSLMTRVTYVRPSSQLSDIVSRIAHEVKLDKHFPSLHLFEGDRSTFIAAHVKTAGIIIFTGRQENAEKLKSQCKRDALFLFNGWGCNPIVVGSEANIEKAAKKAFLARTFNSGQDCAGPDTILVHTNVADSFCRTLTRLIDAAKVGALADKSTDIGPLLDSKALTNAANFLSDHQNNITTGGAIDFRRGIVAPTLIVQSIHEKRNYKEIFSPIFFVNTFANYKDLDLYFSAPAYKNNNMAISFFDRKEKVAPFLPESILLEGVTPLDLDDGNTAYGGFSPGASFASFGELSISRPILPPKELYHYCRMNRDLKPRLDKKSRKEICISFQDSCLDIFSDNLVFGFIFGSVAKDYARIGHDIDTMVVVKNRKADQDRAFLNFLSRLHSTHGMRVDADFPAEIVTQNVLDKAVSSMSVVSLKLHNNSSWAFDQVVWGEVLAGDKTAIIGDKHQLIQYTKACAPLPRLWKRNLLGQIQNSVKQKGQYSRFDPVVDFLGTDNLDQLELSRLLKRFVSFDAGEVS